MPLPNLDKVKNERKKKHKNIKQKSKNFNIFLRIHTHVTHENEIKRINFLLKTKKGELFVVNFS